MSYAPARRLLAAALLALAAIVTATLLAAPSTAKPGNGQGDTVGVMTRNLYLGADLNPALTAGSLDELIEENGQILRDVTANNFPLRARGLAQEILSKRPDLVGLQEVALWRTGPPSVLPLVATGPTATDVRYDYLDLLLDQLNKRGMRYRVVVEQEEADIEAPANENEVDGDGPPPIPGLPPIPNAEINGRLTMRDVILARVGAGVMTANETGAQFDNLLPATIAGATFPIGRGWTSADANVRGSGWFRFVNTHLESAHPRVRGAQAQELVAPGGPATSGLPVVLVGDLNSDDDTVTFPDTYAYNLLLNAGMVNRSTDKPLSCCLDSSLLAVGAGGKNRDFDHQVDHVLTRDPTEVKLRSSMVTGRHPTRGFWSSDHAGVFSALRFK